MFITSVLIENYISTGIIGSFEQYIRIQKGQLRIHLSFEFNNESSKEYQINEIIEGQRFLKA